MGGPIRCQEQMQVLARRLGVAELKLHGLSLLHDIAHGDRTRRLIRADQVSHEEISPFEPVSMLVHDNP
jgi:hypothetical protein